MIIQIKNIHKKRRINDLIIQEENNRSLCFSKKCQIIAYQKFKLKKLVKSVCQIVLTLDIGMTIDKSTIDVIGPIIIINKKSI